jgi:two-component system NtrC family sensor kinase
MPAEDSIDRAGGRPRRAGGLQLNTYYRTLMRSMLMLGLLLPLIPMVLVSSFISYQFYRAHTASYRELPGIVSVEDAHFDRAVFRASVAVLVAGGLIAANAFSLARKTVRTIQAADRKKERMAEQMLQTGKLAAIGELAAGVAHEINNPVAIMIEEAGWIGDLLQGDALDSHPDRLEIERAARQIQTHGKRCKEITHKLLSFARETQFSLTEVNLPALIADVVQISAKRAESSNVTIRTKVQDGLAPALLPPTELQQVLFNLINNALDVMESTGGTLTITAAVDGEILRIAVADTGPGIPEEDRQKIFDPFFTTKPVGKGTGLGLSICYGIVKRIGGSIKVHSDPGRGATFVVSLPLAAGTDEAPQAPSNTGPAPVTGVNRGES